MSWWSRRPSQVFLPTTIANQLSSMSCRSCVRSCSGFAKTRQRTQICRYSCTLYHALPYSKCRILLLMHTLPRTTIFEMLYRTSHCLPNNLYTRIHIDESKILREPKARSGILVTSYTRRWRRQSFCASIPIHESIKPPKKNAPRWNAASIQEEFTR